MSLRSLFDICIRFPESVCFLLDSEIANLIGAKNYLDESISAKIQAEVIFRRWLYRETPSEKNLSERLHQISEIRTASDLCKFNPPESDELGIALKTKLYNFLDADGIIPVVRRKQSFPLSFELIKSQRVEVIDSHGIKHAKWTESVSSIKSDDFTGWTVKLHCALPDMIESDQAESFCPCGDSFHLPVFMALRRELGHMEFNPLEVIFTGSLSEGRLCKVDGVDAKRAMAGRMGAKLFLAPQQPRDSSRVSSLPLHISIQDVEKKIIEILGEKGLSNLDWRKCCERMKSLDKDVHYGMIPLKTSALPRVERYEAVFRESEELEDQLLDALMLKSLIYCETGDTVRSIELNKECKTIARRKKLHEKYYGLAIHHLVNLTDCGKFAEAEDFSGKYLSVSQMKREIGNNAQLHKLLMQLNGTLGQLYLYGAMAGQFGKSAMKKSLSHIEEALGIAMTHDENIYEICKDTNYLHLWYAINKFDSKDENDAYENALKQISSLENGDEKLKNLSYLYRQKWFGAYRNFLLTGKIPEWRKESIYGIPDLRNAEGWTLSMVLKYKGAFLATEGHRDDACKTFESSMEILSKHEECILNRLDGMTVAVQAWRSLRGSRHDAFAEECHKSALEFFERKDILEHYKFASAWRDYLSGRCKSDPQIGYQY